MRDAYKVFVADSLHEKGLEILREAEGIEVTNEPGLPPEKIADRIAPYHALIVRSGTKVTRPIIERARALRVIGRAGTGVDNVDVQAATEKGIVVMNTPLGNAVTTAEHAIALILALARSIPQADRSLREGKWDRQRFVGQEVADKVLGIIGLGNIGSVVADRAQALKMRVVAFDPYIPEDVALRRGVRLVPFETLLAESDFITIHIPLTEETHHLIGEESLRRVKPGVRIVNTARGGIVDEKALAAAIREGRVAGAALDVFEEEPPKENP
ncbi:MAG: hydroxyacid dehydrogenase, partial [Vicinamibacteria bacterium]